MTLAQYFATGIGISRTKSRNSFSKSPHSSCRTRPVPFPPGKELELSPSGVAYALASQSCASSMRCNCAASPILPGARRPWECLWKRKQPSPPSAWFEGRKSRVSGGPPLFPESDYRTGRPGQTLLARFEGSDW